MSNERINVAIVGMGKGGAALLEMLDGDEAVKIVGVAEKNQDAPGIAIAKAMGIPIHSDWRSLLGYEGLDDIIDVTGNPGVYGELLRNKPESVDVMGGPAAKMMWLLIEEREKTKKELKMVNQELESFTYTASHDLKEPLRGIETFSQFLLEDYQDRMDDDGKDYLKRIGAGAARMRNLIDDLLALSRVSRIHNPYESIDSGELVKDAVKRLKAVLEERGIRITVDDELPHVFCDTTKMKEVFYNLIANAMKYNDKEDPSVEVGFKDGEAFFVKDNGKGIEEEYIDSVFQPFKRGAAAKRNDGGSGVGLALVKKIIEEHGGRIWVESTVGKGSTFCFTLPKRKEVSSDERAKRNRDSSGGRQRGRHTDHQEDIQEAAHN